MFPCAIKKIPPSVVVIQSLINYVEKTLPMFYSSDDDDDGDGDIIDQ